MIADSPVLSGLTIGALTLTPAFDAGVASYTATTTNNTNKVTAACEEADAGIAISVNGAAIDNGASAAWTSGENNLLVEVSKGGQTTQYTVVVTKN